MRDGGVNPPRRKEESPLRMAGTLRRQSHSRSPPADQPPSTDCLMVIRYCYMTNKVLRIRQKPNLHFFFDQFNLSFDGGLKLCIFVGRMG